MSEQHRLKTLDGYEEPGQPRQWNRVTPEDRPGTGRRPVPGPAAIGEVNRLLNAVLEAYDGRRPVPQIRALVAPSVYASLSGSRLPRPRHRAHGLHACSPAEGVIEACTRVEAAGRAYALAARFVRDGGRWRCVRFSLLKPQRPAQQRAAA